MKITNPLSWRAVRFVLVLGAIVLVPALAWAAHATVTVSVASTNGDVIGNVEVKNNIAPAQTGRVTLVVFEVKKEGRLVERERQDLGTVSLDAGPGTTANLPFTVTLEGEVDREMLLLLADFASVVGGNPVPHTHAGTLLVSRDD